MTTEFGAGSSVSSFGTRRPKNHVVRVEEYRFTLAFNRCFRGPSVSHVQSCFFFVCCWNRDPRSSFIHFITTAVSAKYLSTYLNDSLHALSSCKQENQSPNPQNIPPFRPKKNPPSSELSFPQNTHHQSLNHPQTELPYQTAHPTSYASLRISNHNPNHAVDRFPARSHRAETFSGHPTLAFRLCRHLFRIDACLESYMADTCLMDTPPASALAALAHVSRPGSRRTRIKLPPSHSKPLPLPALTPRICAPSIYLPKRPCSSHPSSLSLSHPWHSATHSSIPPPRFSR